MDTDKVIGYGLLLTGIGIILFATFSILQVFTGQKNPPAVFSFETPTISLPSSQMPQLELPEGLDLPEGFSLAEKTEAEKLEFKVLPDELVNKVVNMSIHFLLMMFIASSGAKIAGIGTKMVKDIKVVVKEEEIKENLRENLPSQLDKT